MKRYTFIIYILLATTLAAQTPAKVELFPLSAVELLDSPFRDAQLVDLEYILALDPDRLLAPYLREAGLTPKAESYTNWENTGLDGHIGGHYLSALSMMQASLTSHDPNTNVIPKTNVILNEVKDLIPDGSPVTTAVKGATAEDEILHCVQDDVRVRLSYFLSELHRCQDNIATGFIGGTPGSIELWNEIKAGNIRAGGFDLNGRWVPLYNIHKTFAGLRDAYLYADSELARDMLIKLTDWMAAVTAGLTDDQMQDMLRSEHGGLNEVFADVAAITGDEKYLALARRFSHRAILDPLLNKEDRLTGLHANTQIPKVIGFKRIADLDGDRAWDEAAQFFWQTVTRDRSVSMGGNSVREHFHAADDFGPMVTDVQGPETCNTYNMLRLSNLFFQSTAEARYIDFYERGLYNHILASQEPTRGGFVYFTPMRPGHYRVYSQPETSMWCCVGSGLENHAKYGELIYAHSGSDIYVNLFIPSRLRWADRGIALVQQTRFPDDDRVRLRIDETHGKAYAIKLRYPAWVEAGKLAVTINGQPQSISEEPGSYISLHRKWKKGDEVEIVLPMRLTKEQLPDRSDYYSFLYGPIVLATATGTDDLQGLFADDSRGGHIAHGRQISPDQVPTLVGDADGLLSHFARQGDQLAFAYTGATWPEQALEFVPFFRLHNARYAVYLRQATDISDIRSEAKDPSEDLAARTVDLIYPGEQQPESDHFIQFDDSETGTHGARHFRSAKGWFSYELRVKDTASALMLVVHKGDDMGGTRILINDGEVRSEPTVTEDGEQFVRIVYPLPDGLGEGTHRIKFLPKGGEEETGRIYEIRIVK